MLLILGRQLHLRKFKYLASSRFPDGMALSRWANQIYADDDQERAVVLASMKYEISIVHNEPEKN